MQIIEIVKLLLNNVHALKLHESAYYATKPVRSYACYTLTNKGTLVLAAGMVLTRVHLSPGHAKKR